MKGIANSNFRHSSFSGSKDITDLGLQKFCTQCPHLETLDLSECYQLTDNSIKSLAFCCKYMINLNLSGCTMVRTILNRFCILNSNLFFFFIAHRHGCAIFIRCLRIPPNFGFVSLLFDNVGKILIKFA